MMEERTAHLLYDYKPGWVRCILTIGKEKRATGWFAKPGSAYEAAKALAERLDAKIVSAG